MLEINSDKAREIRCSGRDVFATETDDGVCKELKAFIDGMDENE
jgi:hypothetical protein